MMMSTGRPRSPRLCTPFLLCLLATLPVLSSCTAVVGGAAVAAVVGIGALTSRCYDYLDVGVYDELGKKSCAATVTATKDGGSVELNSCYYAPLTDGTWTLRAAQPGYDDALSTVVVEHAHDCTRHVQSVELTLSRPGVVRTPTPIRVAPIPAPQPAQREPSPSPVPDAAPPSTPLPGQPQNLAPASSSTSNGVPAPPAPSAPPAVGVFPPAPSSAAATTPGAAPPSPATSNSVPPSSPPAH